MRLFFEGANTHCRVPVTRTETSEALIPGSGKAPDLVRASSLSDGQKKQAKLKKKKTTKIFSKNGLTLCLVALGF